MPIGNVTFRQAIFLSFFGLKDRPIWSSVDMTVLNAVKNLRNTEMIRDAQEKITKIAY